MEDKLKQSEASYTGGTNGSVADTKRSDLERGFSDAEVQEDFDFGAMIPVQNGGFLNRPKGWER